MIKRQSFLLILLSFIGASSLFAQYNTAGISGAGAYYLANEIEINREMFGLHGFIEFPVNTTSIRFGVNYLSRIGEEASHQIADISTLTTINVMFGKVINEGAIVQFPLFIGGCLFVPNGRFSFLESKETNSTFGLAGSVGLRIYFTKSLF